MARTDTLGHFLTDVADAIREKKGSSDTILASDFDTEIENLPSGGNTKVKENDVIFYDYDGTILYSYTKNDFLALQEMPQNPTNEDLIPAGWNYTLTELKQYVQKWGHGRTMQTYTTKDGASQIHITLTGDRKNPRVGLYLNGSVEIDWGDGSNLDTLTGSSTSTLIYQSHEYEDNGCYIIRIIPIDNVSIYIDGSLITDADGNNYVSNGYKSCVTEFNMGSNVIAKTSLFYSQYLGLERVTWGSSSTTVPNSCFYGCYKLKYVSLPSTVSLVGEQAFRDCRSLGFLIINTTSNISNYMFAGCTVLVYAQIGEGATNFGDNVFENCSLLKTFNIPYSVTGQGWRVFRNCTSLTYMLLPNGIKIRDSYFYYCRFLKYLDCSQYQSVGELQTTNALTGTPSDMKIIVPDSLYENWIVATNWSNYASQIIKKSDWDTLQ